MSVSFYPLHNFSPFFLPLSSLSLLSLSFLSLGFSLFFSFSLPLSLPLSFSLPPSLLLSSSLSPSLSPFLYSPIRKVPLGLLVIQCFPQECGLVWSWMMSLEGMMALMLELDTSPVNQREVHVHVHCTYIIINSLVFY